MAQFDATIIECRGQSDDLGTITGVDLDESCAWGRWFPLEVDGVVVAHIKLDFDGDWVTYIRPVEDHAVKVAPTLDDLDIFCEACEEPYEYCICTA